MHKLPLAFLTCLLAIAPLYSVIAQENMQNAAPLELLSVTPDSEDVQPPKQIVFMFNQSVVPLGRMERTAAEVPIEIKPALPCDWHWLNTTSLSCNLPANATKRATKYEMTVRGIKAQNGATLAEPYVSSFVTARPDVSYSEFQDWQGPARPVIRVTMNQPVTRASLERALQLQTRDGQVYRVRIKPYEQPREQGDAVALPHEKGWFAWFKRKPGAAAQKPDNQSASDDAGRNWSLIPVRDLPIGAEDVKLVLQPGVQSLEGREENIDKRTIVTFATFPEFKFLNASCTTIGGTAVYIPNNPKEHDGASCDPQSGIALNFSAPVLRRDIAPLLKFSPTFMTAEGRKDWINNVYDPDTLNDPYNSSASYSMWLPQGIKPASLLNIKDNEEQNWFKKLWARLRGRDAVSIKDRFGRPLGEALNLTIQTDHRKPNFELPNQISVLESGADTEVPFYVNNLQNYILGYRKDTSAGVDTVWNHKHDLPKVEDIQYAEKFGIKTIMNGQSGIVSGVVETNPPIQKNGSEPNYFVSIVTPYQVQFKFGHFTSLAWVTDLVSGQPVGGAQVKIYNDNMTGLDGAKNSLADTVTDASGVALLPGSDTLDPELTETAYDLKDNRLFVRIEKEKNLSVMPLHQSFELSTSRSYDEGDSVYASRERRYGHIVTWGTSAQGVYRVADPIQYKIYVRAQDTQRLTAAPDFYYHLRVMDPTNKEVFRQQNIRLNEFGALSGEIKLQASAAVGWYRFELGASEEKLAESKPGADSVDGREDERNVVGGRDIGDNDDQNRNDPTNVASDGPWQNAPLSWQPLRVLVSDFTPAPFHVSNQIHGDLFQAGQDVKVDTKAALHAGGPYGNADARITATLEEAVFSSAEPVASKFNFDSYHGTRDSQQVFQTTAKLNDKGDLDSGFNIPAQDIVYGNLRVESAVQDDRGKYVASESSAKYIGVDRLVGVRQNAWTYEKGKPATVDVLAVNERGVPVDDTTITGLFEHLEVKSAKVKGAGNAYLTNLTRDWVKVGDCATKPAKAPSSCSFTPDAAGEYRFTASVTDTKGRAHKTVSDLYVTGAGDMVWNDDNDTSLTIIPEKKAYKIGDTAKFLVKNPYPGAEALITVERYGILDHFVQKFDGNTPIVEIPVKPDYMPGFYLSVSIMSPRVEKAPSDKGLDLGKPSARMGYAKITVDDPVKQIDVKATTDKAEYRPRDTVNLSLEATQHLKDKKEPIEFAVAVLDESVFDLIQGGRGYFDPYKGLYNFGALDVDNYSLINALVGRQKFEKKGANPGGDGGGNLDLRNLFKYVSYWNPSVKADANGKAKLDFSVPDNLTGWRVLVLAVTPTDRLGLGDVKFAVNRPTELRPVMPNQVSEGDAFTAGFSVMNRTDHERTITVSVKADGAITNDSEKQHEEKITLKPYERKTVQLKLKTPMLPLTADVTESPIHFIAVAKDAEDGDKLDYVVPVIKHRTLMTAAEYGSVTDKAATVNIKVPDNAYPDSGTLNVVLAPSVIGNIKGAFQYIRNYPYWCWEQRMTKALMAMHFKNLRAYLPEQLEWKDADTLPQKMLDDASSYQAPNGGMTYWVPQDQYADPYLSAYTALSFNWLRASGNKVPDDVELKLQAYLLSFLRQNIAPSFYSEGMSSSVRAVALAALAPSGKITLDDIKRYQPHVKEMSLFGKAEFLDAAQQLHAPKETVLAVVKDILAHSDQSAGKFQFTEEMDDGYTRILSTPMRDNCAILSSLTRAAQQDDVKAMIADVPEKLVRTITQTRGKGKHASDHWENTQENIFCLNGLTDYARVYEADKPAMNVTVKNGADEIGQAAFHDLRDPAVKVGRTINEKDMGKDQSVQIARAGTGRAYYGVQLQYAPKQDFANDNNAGIEIRREYSIKQDKAWKILPKDAALKPGDVVRVDLFLDLGGARNFVVVDDPVPGGFEPVNRDLATASKTDDDAAQFDKQGGSWWFKFNDWQEYGGSNWSFYHKELRHDSARFYADYLPAGHYHLSYAAQVIAPGRFNAAPAKAEEMYNPDVYGLTRAQQLNVEAK